MWLFLIRHAHAGDRSRWNGDDRLRPLSARGERQARAIAERLRGEDVARLASSPAVRCLETLRPLADETGLPLDSDVRLAEGSDGPVAWTLFDELLAAGAPVAVCSHGDIIPDFLTGIRQRGASFADAPTWPKASIWVVEGNGVAWTAARYIPPPEESRRGPRPGTTPLD